MLYSLGHSTYPAADFITICQTAAIDTIIDTRSHPGSKAHPQYNQNQMGGWLNAAGLGYEWWPALGGWADRHADLAFVYLEYDVTINEYCHNSFPKQRIARTRSIPEGGTGFTNYGFHDYQFFMTLSEFLNGAQRLLDYSRTKNLACICCEACWSRCHRSMIADYLVWRGADLTHLTPRFRKIKQPRTVVTAVAHSTAIGARLNRYHPAVMAAWRDHETFRT